MPCTFTNFQILICYPDFLTDPIILWLPRNHDRENRCIQHVEKTGNLLQNPKSENMARIGNCWSCTQKSWPWTCLRNDYVVWNFSQHHLAPNHEATIFDKGRCCDCHSDKSKQIQNYTSFLRSERPMKTWKENLKVMKIKKKLKRNDTQIGFPTSRV